MSSLGCYFENVTKVPSYPNIKVVNIWSVIDMVACEGRMSLPEVYLTSGFS